MFLVVAVAVRPSPQTVQAQSDAGFRIGPAEISRRAEAAEPTHRSRNTPEGRAEDGLFAHQIDRAGEGVGPVQEGARSFEHLHPLQVVEVVERGLRFRGAIRQHQSVGQRAEPAHHEEIVYPESGLDVDAARVHKGVAENDRVLALQLSPLYDTYRSRSGRQRQRQLYGRAAEGGDHSSNHHLLGGVGSQTVAAVCERPDGTQSQKERRQSGRNSVQERACITGIVHWSRCIGHSDAPEHKMTVAAGPPVAGPAV